LPEEKSHELDELQKNLDTQIKDVPLSFIWQCHFLWLVHTTMKQCGMQQRKYDKLLCIMAGPTIPTSAVNYNKSKMFTHSRFSVHFLT
jgi:hypothetical protein